MPYEIPKHLPDVEGEAVDATKKFTNTDNEPFEFTYANIKYEVAPSETKSLPKYLVNYATHHLARKIFKRNALIGQDPNVRLGNIRIAPSLQEESALVKPMIAANFGEELKTEQTAKEPEKTEDKTEENKCSDCGFVAKSDFGLLVHKKKHKK